MAYREAKSRGRAGSKQKLDHMEIRKTQNGGHTVEHHFDNSGMEQYKRPVTYSFSTGPEMVKHVMDQSGVKDKDMVAHLHGDNEPEPGGGEEDAAEHDRQEGAESDVEEDGDS